MATLQKFKFFATQCSVIGSPSRAAPTSSPVIHIRRRKTLRMLLGKASATSTAGNFHRRFLHSQNNRRQDSGGSDLSSEKPSDRVAGGGGVRSKLKDLFVSSPPEDAAAERLLKDGGGSVVAVKRGGDGGGGRAFSATLKQRLLMRRAWRPVLVGIPEVSP
ncbi:uncharacterized protein LOC141641498 [Silene latifolia]|uniref:uncharacterized protein LOC141641498 n=1 Tax=Silene latifolia TaxID=37657 RepID=UPI003D7811C3